MQKDFSDPVNVHKRCPNLATAGYRITSRTDESHNCIAYAMGEKRRWWEPLDYVLEKGGLVVWPTDSPLENTVSAWRSAFRIMKYEDCDSPDFEPGFEKLAIFGTSENDPEHVAWQPCDRNGQWKSKMGWDADIDHVLEAIGGGMWGTVLAIMKRRRGYRKDKRLLSLAIPVKFHKTKP